MSRRAAAQKASQMTAEQLESSPIPSDDEAGSGAGVVGRRGAKARSSANTRYTTQLSAGSDPGASKQASGSSPSTSQHQKLKSSTMTPKVKVSGVPSFKADSVTSDSDIEVIGFTAPKLTLTQPPSPSADGAASKEALVPLRIPGDTTLGKKRVLSMSEPSPQGSTASLSPLTSPESTRRSSGPRGKLRHHLEPPSPVVNSWSLDTLGRLVWLRIKQSGEVSESRTDSVWWPAQVS